MAVATIDLVIIITYLVGVLGIGFWISRGENSDGFFVNNRSTRTFLLIFTALSTSIGAGSVIGVASAAYTSGISYGVGFMIISAASWLFMAWIAPRIKEIGDSLQAYTIGDFLAHRYGESVRAVAGIITLIATFIFTAIQFVAFANVAHIVIGMSIESAILLAAGITITYTIFAGLKGDFYTDAIQFFVMLPVFITLLWKGLKVVSLGELFTELPDGYLNLFNFGGASFFFVSIVFGFGLLLVSVEVWQRIFAAFDGKTARRAFLWSAFLKVAVIGASMLIGIIALKHIPDVTGDEAFFALMEALLPQGLLGLGFASVLAILMSTADSMLMAASAVLTKDYYLVRHPEAKDQDVLRFGRVAIFVFGGLALITALVYQDIVGLAVLGAQILSVFIPTFFGGLLWKRANKEAALWSIISGFTSLVFFLFFMPKTAFIPSLVVSLSVFLYQSLTSTEQSNA